jgi:hypothetical protein
MMKAVRREGFECVCHGQIIKLYSDKLDNYPEMITTQCLSKTKLHIVPHKYVHILSVNQKLET